MVLVKQARKASKTLKTKMADENDKSKEKDDKPKHWKETCIGIWTKGAKGESDTFNWICNGISIVKIDENVKRSSVKPSQTRGLQIIIQEMAEKGKQSQQQDDTDRERDPQRHVFPPEDTDLGKRVLNILRKKTESVEQQVEHYTREGVSIKDAWNGLSGFMVSCYQTSARILSYCKPKEKLHQVYNFASSRIKDIGSQWSSDSDNNGKKK